MVRRAPSIWCTEGVREVVRESAAIALSNYYAFFMVYQLSLTRTKLLSGFIQLFLLFSYCFLTLAHLQRRINKPGVWEAEIVGYSSKNIV